MSYPFLEKKLSIFLKTLLVLEAAFKLEDPIYNAVSEESKLTLYLM